jgi:thiol-disulfide isomerase/thioredoxin
MKLLILFISIHLLFSQKAETSYTLMYFGATSCGPCMRETTIQAIKDIKKDFIKDTKLEKVKFVIVCIDDSLDEALTFINKYKDWDEFSLGSFYNNELMLDYLNKTARPGIPHILLFKDIIIDKPIPEKKNRVLVAEIVGSDKIIDWVKNGFPIEK